MSFLSDAVKKYTGQIRSFTAKPTHEAPKTREAAAEHETRSLNLPVKDNGTKDLAGSVKDELARTADALEGIRNQVANFEDMQNSMKSYFEEQKKDTAENIHKENVKVYRNVQAVVVDESAKVRETADRASSKAGTAMIFAILACGIALIHFVFDILVTTGVF